MVECNTNTGYKRGFLCPPYKNKGNAVLGSLGRYKRTKDEESLKPFGSVPTPPIHSASLGMAYCPQKVGPRVPSLLDAALALNNAGE
jgi:hypothetical protein